MSGPLTASQAAGPVRLFSLHAAFWSLLAALPFLLFPAIHHVRWGGEATGFTTYDLPYYAANARAILDRGHAGSYPNPFDPDPAAPVIYFHWLIGLLAVLIGPMHLPPGLALLAIQAVGAFASARVMYSLVAWLLPESRGRTLLYLLTMWSGGLLILGKLLANVAQGHPWYDALLALDPGQGLWCLNFGRNLILPTEAVYHALMLGLWLAILKGRWKSAAVLLAAICSTHPFTGAQALAIVGAFLIIQAFLDFLLADAPPRTPRTLAGVFPSLPPLTFLAAYTLIATLFVGYYFVFLPGFPQHREIQSTWTLGWVMSGTTIALAYIPAALLAWRAIRSDRAWRHRIRLLLVAAGVSFLLANHHWFVTPHQPIHFTRGYIWTPLWLSGLPALAAILETLSRRLQVFTPLGLAALVVIATSDNAGFLLVNALQPPAPGFGLSSDERAAFDEFNRTRFRGVLLTDNERLGYLAAAMTTARPWIGHKYNTPKFDERLTALAAFKSTSAAGELLEQVDAALTADPRVTRRLQDAGWSRSWSSDSLSLWLKR